VWGWEYHAVGGYSGPWSHQVRVNNIRIRFAHAENMGAAHAPHKLFVGPANGIGISAQMGASKMSVDQLTQELQQELGEGIKVYRAGPSTSGASGVQALIEYGNGITLQELHDRIVKFASALAKHQ
jgi:hypothetical protein